MSDGFPFAIRIEFGRLAVVCLTSIVFATFCSSESFCFSGCNEQAVVEMSFAIMPSYISSL